MTQTHQRRQQSILLRLISFPPVSGDKHQPCNAGFCYELRFGKIQRNKKRKEIPPLEIKNVRSSLQVCTCAARFDDSLNDLLCLIPILVVEFDQINLVKIGDFA